MIGGRLGEESRPDVFGRHWLIRSCTEPWVQAFSGPGPRVTSRHRGLLHEMIQTFADRDTAQLFHEERNRRFAAIARVALRKLIQLNSAVLLSDLAVPPGNRLEALQGNWRDFHSIRVNDQWRVVFRWTDRGPIDVAIRDYH